MKHYQTFIENKTLAAKPVGMDIGIESLNDGLFPFQKHITRHALKLGKGAIFANTGLGKSRQQIEWSHQINQGGDRVLMLAPLAVVQQTVKEAAAIGIELRYCENQADVGNGINITNYDKLHKFDGSKFGAISLDESSLIKHDSSASFGALCEFAAGIHYRSCWTATPAPNDYMEFGTHAEFLGIMKRDEMLATFFRHDGGENDKWILAGHGEAKFWEWLCSWAIALKKPSDIGFSDEGYNPPPLNEHHHVVDGKLTPEAGELFAVARNMNDRRRARRLSTEDRVAIAASTCQ